MRRKRQMRHSAPAGTGFRLRMTFTEWGGGTNRHVEMYLLVSLGDATQYIYRMHINVKDSTPVAKISGGFKLKST